MEANLTITVDVESVPRLVSHLLEEEENKLEDLSKKFSKAHYMSEKGSVFPVVEEIQQIRQMLTLIDGRLRQAENLCTGLAAGLSQQETRQDGNVASNILEQAQNVEKFSSFLEKMEEEDEVQHG
tara:strand:+ start:91 stop:465 length:375 start_codon:yes stop_codon:yes gene_type:complete